MDFISHFKQEHSVREQEYWKKNYDIRLYELIVVCLDCFNSIYFLFSSIRFKFWQTDSKPSVSYRSFCIAVDIGLTVGLTDLFLSHIIISSAILSSAHCAVSRASASWSQQSSIVSLSDLTACNKVYVKHCILPKHN